MPEKRRKDAVLTIEYLVTASPESMEVKSKEAQDAYFREALLWIQERHGEKNVVYAGIHRDEKTPHLYAYAVPLDPETGRLNARRWLGGRQALSEMQTDFAKKVGHKHDLERGLEGSKARHQRVKRHYAELNREMPTPSIKAADLEPQVLRKRLFFKDVENPEQVADRLNKVIGEGYGPTREMALEARQARQKEKEAIDTAKKFQTVLGGFPKPSGGCP